jgi:hypothetical protein
VLDAPGVGPRERLAALGRAYVDFGLVHPALFDLMFRAGELHADDPELRAARSAAISGLRAAVGDLATGERAPSTPTLVSWAFVHGLVALVRGGALQSAAGVDPDAGADLTHRLTDVFATAFAERATPDAAPG